MNILGEKTMFWKIGDFSENRKFFPGGIENFCDRIHEPQTSNQIDAADKKCANLCLPLLVKDLSYFL